MLIANMGLFWKREDVYWGEPGRGRRGQLLGVLSTERSGTPTDFWNQVGMYALYGDYRLAYVGQAGSGDMSRLGNRLRQHLRDDLAGRWNMFSWFGLSFVREGDGQLSDPPAARNVPMGEMLNILEGVLIAAAEPPLNGQDGRFGSVVERYLQVRDPALGPRQDEMIRSIHETLGSLSARLPAEGNG